MNPSSESVIVYWAPWWDPREDFNLDFLFHNPIPCYQDLLQHFHPPIVTKNYMQCPAVKNELEQIYLFLNPTLSEMKVSVNEEGQVGILYGDTESHTVVPGLLRHAPTLTNHSLIEYQLSYIFFAEEPLEVTMTSPYFHKTNYTNYASIVPGTYDCGQWLRPLNLEMQLWSGNDYLKIEKDEPLVYFKFNTNKKIIFKRFKPTVRLHDISASMVRFKAEPRWYNLKSRYENFHRSSIRGIILQEIQDNLLTL